MHQVGIYKILRYALDDKTISNFYQNNYTQSWKYSCCYFP